MSIKSDRWIRRMAETQGMIEPYEPGQVKQVNGERIVSYGTSSYGYDVRCSREFKIFTNINSTIVDPKHFDSGSFVAPLILIVLGLFFLASNLGWTDASLGHLLAKWWPLILVAAGVTMLVDRSKK